MAPAALCAPLLFCAAWVLCAGGRPLLQQRRARVWVQRVGPVLTERGALQEGEVQPADQGTTVLQISSLDII